MTVELPSQNNGKRKQQGRIGAGLFLIGLALAVLFSFVVFWPDQEASNFDRSAVKQEPLRALRCPLFLTPQDEAAIRLTLTNTHVRPTSLRVRARIAEESIALFREDVRQLDLQPGAHESLSWPVAMEDAVYDLIVMARVNQFQRTPFPARMMSCGVMALDVPLLTGTQIATLLALAAAGCLIGGAWLWVRVEQPLEGRRRGAAIRAGIMLLLVLLSIGAGLLQMPALALILLLLSAVFVVSLLERLS